MTTGSRMKARRKELGVPVDQIASALGVSIATIYRYENGDIEKVPGSVLEPLSKVLCTTPAYLMGWEDDPVDYDDGDLLAEIPLSYMEASDGDPKRAYAAMEAANEDARREQSKIYDFARNEHEEEMLLLARHIAPIPEDQRKKLIDALKSSADFYLNAMGITQED